MNSQPKVQYTFVRLARKYAPAVKPEHRTAPVGVMAFQVNPDSTVTVAGSMVNILDEFKRSKAVAKAVGKLKSRRGSMTLPLSEVQAATAQGLAGALKLLPPPRASDGFPYNYGFAADWDAATINKNTVLQILTRPEQPVAASVPA